MTWIVKPFSAVFYYDREKIAVNFERESSRNDFIQGFGSTRKQHMQELERGAGGFVELMAVYSKPYYDRGSQFYAKWYRCLKQLYATIDVSKITAEAFDGEVKRPDVSKYLKLRAEDEG